MDVDETDRLSDSSHRRRQGSGDGSAYMRPPSQSGLSHRHVFQMPKPQPMGGSLNRRGSSGVFITSMFGSRLRHLQKLHGESFLGLNSICLPGGGALPSSVIFRSSLPATPLATPCRPYHFQLTESELKERLCRTPSPRKNFSSFHEVADQYNRNEPTEATSSACSATSGVTSHIYGARVPTNNNLNDGLNLMSENSQYSQLRSHLLHEAHHEMIAPSPQPMDTSSPMPSPIPDVVPEEQETGNGSPFDSGDATPTNSASFVQSSNNNNTSNNRLNLRNSENTRWNR